MCVSRDKQHSCPDPAAEVARQQAQLGEGDMQTSTPDAEALFVGQREVTCIDDAGVFFEFESAHTAGFQSQGCRGGERKRFQQKTWPQFVSAGTRRIGAERCRGGAETPPVQTCPDFGLRRMLLLRRWLRWRRRALICQKTCAARLLRWPLRVEIGAS